jgi:hypothetical protein
MRYCSLNGINFFLFQDVLLKIVYLCDVKFRERTTGRALYLPQGCYMTYKWLTWATFCNILNVSFSLLMTDLLLSGHAVHTEPAT